MTSSNDSLLHAVRRLDWRFLLPNPALHHVAYVGPGDGTLLLSLRLASASLTAVRGGGALPTGADSFDLVVIERASVEAVRQHAAWVRPGGCLYAEFTGRGGASRSAAGVLRRLDFTEVATYWHWPDFDEATRIVPLSEPKALSHSILKDRRGWQASLVRGGVRALQSARLIDRVAAFSSVVGQR